MTFLLFLASVAVLEYLARGTRQKSDSGVKTESETATSDLLALGQALNTQTMGKAADFERVPDQAKAPSGPTQT
jgi:hypothetical protein